MMTNGATEQHRRQDVWFGEVMTHLENDAIKLQKEIREAAPNTTHTNTIITPHTNTTLLDAQINPQSKPEGVASYLFSPTGSFDGLEGPNVALGGDVATLLASLPTFGGSSAGIVSPTTPAMIDPFQAFRESTSTSATWPPISGGAPAGLPAPPLRAGHMGMFGNLGGEFEGVSEGQDNDNASEASSTSGRGGSRARSSSLNINATPFMPKAAPTTAAAPHIQQQFQHHQTFNQTVVPTTNSSTCNTWPPAGNVPAEVQAVWNNPTPTASPTKPSAKLLPLAAAQTAKVLPTTQQQYTEPKKESKLPANISNALQSLSYAEAEFPKRWAPTVKQIIFVIHALTSNVNPNMPFAKQLSQSVYSTLNVQRMQVQSLPQSKTVPTTPEGAPGLVEVLGEYGWDGKEFPEGADLAGLETRLKELESRGSESDVRNASRVLMLDTSVGPERITYASRVLNDYRRGIAGLDAAFVAQLVYDILKTCFEVDPKDVSMATTTLNTLFLILKRCSAGDRSAVDLRRGLKPEEFCGQLLEAAKLHGMEQKASWCASKLIAADRDRTPNNNNANANTANNANNANNNTNATKHAQQASAKEQHSDVHQHQTKTHQHNHTNQHNSNTAQQHQQRTQNVVNQQPNTNAAANNVAAAASMLNASAAGMMNMNMNMNLNMNLMHPNLNLASLYGFGQPMMLPTGAFLGAFPNLPTAHHMPPPTHSTWPMVGQTRQ